MIRLTPAEVRERFGQFFYEKFLTIVDPAKGKIEIVEIFGNASGSAEWTAINRCRAGGIVESCELLGKLSILRARLGEEDVRFGPADGDQGGQAIEGALVEGDRVRTKWAGIAGMSLSTSGSLPQAPGVIETWYPSEQDLLVGGNKTSHVQIVTPLYEKISIGIDDTDDPEGGATFALVVRAQREAVKLDGVEPLLIRFAQLWPRSPFKTTNCTSSLLTFAVRPGAAQAMVKLIVDMVKAQTRSKDTGIAILKGIGVPKELNAFGWEVKRRLVSLEEAKAFEGMEGLELIEPGPGKQGRIGALAALGLAEEKYAAALENDRGLKLINRW
ncbi:MAG: tRNA(Ile2) 2-agmatinylcytidine synthetase [Syntrophaceae bacterium]